MASPCAGNVGRNVVSQIALHSGLQETMYSLEKEYPPGLISVWTLIIPPRDTSYCLLRHSENIEFFTTHISTEQPPKWKGQEEPTFSRQRPVEGWTQCVALSN